MARAASELVGASAGGGGQGGLETSSSPLAAARSAHPRRRSVRQQFVKCLSVLDNRPASPALLEVTAGRRYIVKVIQTTGCSHWNVATVRTKCEAAKNTRPPTPRRRRRRPAAAVTPRISAAPRCSLPGPAGPPDARRPRLASPRHRRAPWRRTSATSTRSTSTSTSCARPTRSTSTSTRSRRAAPEVVMRASRRRSGWWRRGCRSCPRPSLRAARWRTPSWSPRYARCRATRRRP
ncbi:Protein of unknown function [Gryllus bimaculatus]|nr:Protein of unknown function [Gryllus bimaculatus]